MSEKPPISKEDLLAKLEKGEKIEGHYIADISLVKRTLSYPIEINDCVIGRLDFNKSVFQKDVYLRRCTINMLVLSDCVFEKIFDFKKSKTGRGKIQGAEFQNGVNFNSCQLSYTTFFKSSFRGKSNFSWTTINGSGNFDQTCFEDGANFSYSNFQTSASFQESQWQGVADFRNSKVSESLDFSKAKFTDDLLLGNSVIQHSVNLFQVQVEQLVDFSHVLAGHNVDLTMVQPGEEQSFRFRNISTSSIILDREAIEGHVYPELEKKFYEAAKEYGFLRLNFQNLNRFDDEDWAYYRFKKMERKAKKLTWWNPVVWLKRLIEVVFLDFGCGYGTKPFRTLGACGILILAFASLYFWHFADMPVQEEYGFSSAFINQVIYAINVSLMAFSGGYADVTIAGPMKLAVMLEYLIGVVFLGLFVVAFSRKVIR